MCTMWCGIWNHQPSRLPRYAKNKTLLTLSENALELLDPLRYDFIDSPGVLGSYVAVNSHSLYDLSVLVSIGCILRSGNVPKGSGMLRIGGNLPMYKH